MRFKCVCKSWLSLIFDPQFGISHYDLAASPTHRLLLRSNDFYAQSFYLQSSLRNYHRNLVNFPLPFPSPPRHHHDYFDFCNQPEIVGSCRGILLLYYSGSQDIIIWNPTIGVHKRFTDPFLLYGLYDGFLYGFGYDAAIHDYLLVIIALPEWEPLETEIHVFSFKTESWKFKSVRAQVLYGDLEFELADEVGKRFQVGSFLNGALHWLVFSPDNVEPVIIASDLIRRSLSEIPLPNHLTLEKYIFYGLRVMGGCLSVCCSVQYCKTAGYG